jgi:hypothetical protein
VLDENQALFDALDGLGLEHDTEIVMNAVEILRKDGIHTLLALDSDITAEQQRDAINEVIQDIEGEELVLDIKVPGIV